MEQSVRQLALRPYQEQCVQALSTYFREKPGKNPLVVLPTAAGKSVCIGEMARRTIENGNRILVLAHVRELVAQNAGKISIICGIEPSIYSAGMNRRECNGQIVCASIQSVFDKAGELCKESPFAAIVVDECHRIPSKGMGRYGRLLGDMQAINPGVRIIGLSATPYRLDRGLCYGENHFLHSIGYEVGIKELTDQGYLSPIRTGQSIVEFNTDEIEIRKGEFVASQASQVFSDSKKLKRACDEITDAMEDRTKCIVFCCSVEHAEATKRTLAKIIDSDSESVGIVIGTTSADERDETIQKFKDGRLSYLVNCGVLCEGFDAPDIDCVALLRATTSPGLYYQMVGRGLRLAQNKKDCLLLDYGGNVNRHGPIERIRPPRPAKKTGKKRELDSATASNGRNWNHSQTAFSQVRRAIVFRVDYDIRRTKSGYRALVIQHYVSEHSSVNQWLMFEHPRAMFAARKIWEEISSQAAYSTQQAYEIAVSGKLAKPGFILCEKNDQGFDTIVGKEFA